MRSVGDTRAAVGCRSSFVELVLLEGTYARWHLHQRTDATVARGGLGWVTFHLLDAGSEKLVRLYRSAQVHVLASSYETTGPVSLEAALCGCTIVSTSRGYASEYLDADALYCDSQDPNSIRQAVEQALRTPLSERLRTRILENFTWRHVRRQRSLLTGEYSVAAPILPSRLEVRPAWLLQVTMTVD